MRNVLGSSLDIPHLYELARELLKQFNADSGFVHEQTSRVEFHMRVVRAAGTQCIPRLEDQPSLDRFPLPKIFQDAADSNVMQRVTVWLAKR